MNGMYLLLLVCVSAQMDNVFSQVMDEAELDNLPEQPPLEEHSGDNDETTSRESLLNSVNYEVMIIYERQYDKLLADEQSLQFHEEKRAVEEELATYIDEQITPSLRRIEVDYFLRIPESNTGVVLAISLERQALQELKDVLDVLIGTELNHNVIINAKVIRGEQCEPLAVPLQSSVTCDNDVNVGSTCEFTCDQGNIMEGASELHCAADGIWDNVPPRCIRVRCPPHLDAEGFSNGIILCTNHNHYESECSFFCNQGYRLVGSSINRCENGGEWTHPKPFCELIPVDCVIGFTNWSRCEVGIRYKSSFIVQPAVGSGRPCPSPFARIEEVCVDCQVAWGGWKSCLNGRRVRNEIIVVNSVGAGEPCTTMQSEIEPCVHCKVVWGKWSKCFRGRRYREEKILTKPVGAGKKCPILQGESQGCPDSIVRPIDDVICRFTRSFLGYPGNHTKRDLLFLGDESGSIGWINFEKMKDLFKAVSRNLQGGIGATRSQLAMMSFATFGRIQFNFFEHGDVNSVLAAIDRSFYRGGWRSNIGNALVEANIWMFQQTAGMRSFPASHDEVSHEILLATDGCRTSNSYYLRRGINIVRKRGIKLSVVGIESIDESCRGAINQLEVDGVNVYRVESWQDLENLTESINNRECRPQ